MTRELIERNWAAMEAFKAGKPIQFRLGAADQWHDYSGCDPAFHATDIKWRAKPEPREVWINEYPGPLDSSAIHLTKESADMNANQNRIRAVRFREVVE